MNIENIDGNFTIQSEISRVGLCYKNVTEEPFTVHGLIRENGKYVRMPEEIARSVNHGVEELNPCTAGGRVRFVTDSPYVAIAVKYNVILKMAHFAYSGSIGFDIYADDGNGDIHVGTYITGGDQENFEAVVDFPTAGLHTVTIHFPLYSGVDELFVGTKEGCILQKAPDYAVTAPVVFYGSSITQGGCASRPGNCYDNILSRLLSCEHVNLGFSGSAFGEQTMAEYIASLDMSAFILDYDHNSTPEQLAENHENFYKTVRRANPDLPIIMLSRPNYHSDADALSRIAIIQKTYDNAVEAGDQNVYFIPGPDLIEEKVRETALVDAYHPNDSGFVSMAHAVKRILEKCI